MGYCVRVFPSPVTEKPAAQPPVSLVHSWHAPVDNLHTTCGQQRIHDSFRFAPFSYPVPDTRGVHSFPTVCCLECMRALFPLFPSARSFQESRAHHSHRRRLWMSATHTVSDKIASLFSLSTWCVLILRTCGAEKLRFLFVTPLASYKSGE